MKFLQAITSLLSALVSLFDRTFPALMAYKYSKEHQQKKQLQANYERTKKNADIAASADVDNPVDRL